MNFFLKHKRELFLLFFILAAGWCLVGAKPVLAAGGLTLNFQIDPGYTDWTKPWHGETRQRILSQVNYDNLDSAFPERMIPGAWQRQPSSFVVSGSVYIPAADYKLRFISSSIYSYVFNVVKDGAVLCENNSSGAASCNTQKFNTGWYDIWIYSIFTVSSQNPYYRLQWQPPGGSYSAILAANLSPYRLSDREILIPSSGREQIDYLVGGVGIKALADAGGGDAELEINLPPGITTNDILSDGAWLFWNAPKNPAMQIKNLNTGGGTLNLTGDYLTRKESGSILPTLVKQIPISFLADGDSKIYLSFKVKSDMVGGIGLLLVYKDVSKPNGKMVVRPTGEGVFLGVTTPVSFDIEHMDPSVLKPFFMFEDGGSRWQAANMARHNYLAQKTSITQPGEMDLFAPTAAIIIPTAAGAAPNPNGPVQYWYPVYGREGSEFDVLAPTGNYAPNQISLKKNKYITSADGAFDAFSVTPGNKWVSFQFDSGDFLGDGSAALNINESGVIYAFGLLTYDESKLIICPDIPIYLNTGATQTLKAVYWYSHIGLPSCAQAQDDILNGSAIDVTFDSVWVSSDPTKVAVVSPAVISAVAPTGESPVNIIVTYNYFEGTKQATSVANVTNYCSYKTCQNNNCVATIGTIPCPADECDQDLVCKNNFEWPNWKEVAPGD